ncbi:MAG: hypothetical protein ACMUEM_04880 [Flavobacteriales bacterium AspAUS03]
MNDKTIESLLDYKEGDHFLYESAFKIISLSETNFVAAVRKDRFAEAQSKVIYQKAIYIKEFIALYLTNMKNVSEDHYNALCSGIIGKG